MTDRNRSNFLILFMTLAVFIITFAHVSAQDIDVGGMDNAQLTELLLQIMQKLDQTEEPAETPEPTATPTPVPTNTPLPELSDDKAELEALLTAIMQKLQEEPEEPAAAPEIPAVAAAVSETEAEPAGDILSFTIYENKKLMIEKLPEYMFIQPTQPPKPDKPEKKDGSNNGGKKDRSPEDCEYHCAYEVCPWADNQCYFNCYYSCQNQPVPDWAKY